MGDTVLRLVAQRLARVVRAGDTLARFGGDEFTILMRGKPSPQGSSSSSTACCRF